MVRSRRLIPALLIAVLSSLVVAPATSAAPPGDEPTPPPWLDIEGGVSQPQFSLDDAIEETIFVETGVDSDLDGDRDRVRLQLSRPGETESDDITVPVVFEHSPYRYNVGGATNHNVDYEVLPQEHLQPDNPGQPRTQSQPSRQATAAKATPDLPGTLDDYWVPRGYAVVLGESIGTGYSDGCPTIGDQDETLGTKAIIDWLNGDARAWTEDGEPVEADWTTGDVGMLGVSYNGTLPNMVATTGVEGLRTIVPIAAISSWYDYYRANGLVRAPHSAESGAGENAYQGEDADVLARFVHGEDREEQCAHVTERLTAEQDRVTGDYSEFWRERDYRHRANGIDASVFVVHGLADYNVMPTAFATWWEQLERNTVPRKIHLHTDGHRTPADSEAFQHTLNRWMDHWLFGVDNGIMDEPTAAVQNPDGTYERHADWPVPGSKPATLRLSAPNSTDPGTLSTTPQHGGQGPQQSFVDRGRELDTDTDLVPEPDTAHPNRLAYLSPELDSDVHLSGTPEMSLRASVDNRYAANLTTVLVDYGPEGSGEEPVVVTRGWTDVQNRQAEFRSSPIRQGKDYTFRWELEPDDYAFDEGNRIGVVVASTDMRFTLRPEPGTELTVTPGTSEISLPVVGGKGALGF